MLIALDESGTHGADFLVIGALFVPQHHALLTELLGAKETHKYYNRSPRLSAKYKEMHFSDIRSQADVTVAKEWTDIFIKHSCWFRSIVVDWSIWNPRYFGNPFEEESLKKIRAYKKWAEMLLHPEVQGVRGAWLQLDELRVCHGYEVIHWLKEGFTRGHEGRTPRISQFQTVRSWKDQHQIVQLCDLLTGCIYQTLVPSGKPEKSAVRDYLYYQLQRLGVKSPNPGYWKGFAKTTLRERFPKFSEWFWKPEK